MSESLREPEAAPAYRLIRTRRKTLSLTVTREAEALVRAPLHTPMREIDRFVAAHRDWIARQTARATETARLDKDLAQREEELCSRAARELPPLLADYGRRMGVTPTGLRITGARTRFGSCSAKNSLCFSWRLMAYPPAAVEYVVVHELAHIRHKNHGPEFYREIARVMPDYPKRICLLRQVPK